MKSEVLGGYEHPVTADTVGGKALNLFQLAEISQGRDFLVPNFIVIPVGYRCTEEELHTLFDSLEKPLAVRSSSPLEDSSRYSYAGQFDSVLNVSDFKTFQEAIGKVIDSATGEKVRGYNVQHGLPLDDRMAVIVQTMIEPNYAGVCYSSNNEKDPKTIIEYVFGLSDRLLSGEDQGYIVSIDSHFHIKNKYGQNYLPKLKRVVRVAHELERFFGQQMDIEFAVTHEGSIYVVQARPITRPDWPEIHIPDIKESDIILRADIVHGSGTFTGPVVRFISSKYIEEFAQNYNLIALDQLHEQYSRLYQFNLKHPEGFCLIADSLEDYNAMVKINGLNNMRVLVTLNYASRFSHPAKVISETGAFYLGVVGRTDILDQINTGDTISVVSDQRIGILYNLVKPDIVHERLDLKNVPIVPYKKAIQMQLADFDEIDDRLFMAESGDIGILITDYNAEFLMPEQVFYHIVDRQGNIIQKGEYKASEVRHKCFDFPSLLDYLLFLAKKL